MENPTPFNNELALKTLQKNRDWPKLWQMFDLVPIQWGRWILKQLQAAKWHPPSESEGKIFNKLAKAAAVCLKDTFDWANLIGEVYREKGHTFPISELAFSADGQTLGSFSQKGWDVCFWQFEKRGRLKKIATYEIPHRYELSGGYVMQDGQKKFLPYLKEYGADGPRGAVLNVDHKLLIIGAQNNLAGWRKEHWAWLHPLEDILHPQKLKGGIGNISYTALSSNGRYFVIGGKSDICFWDLETPDRRQMLTSSGYHQHYGTISLDRTGTILACVKKSNEVELWQLPEGTLLNSFKANVDSIYKMGFTATGHLVLEGAKWKQTGKRKRCYQCYQLLDGILLSTITIISKKFSSPLWAITPYSFNLIKIAQAAKKPLLEIWRLNKKELLHTFKIKVNKINHLCISPNEQYLVLVTGDTLIRIWDIAALRWGCLALNQLTHADFASIRVALSQRLSKQNQHWLKFLLLALQYHYRFDVEFEPFSNEDNDSSYFGTDIEL